MSIVLKELLSAHIEARAEDDRRQQEVKEQVLLELVDLCALVAETEPEDNGYDYAGLGYNDECYCGDECVWVTIYPISKKYFWAIFGRFGVISDSEFWDFSRNRGRIFKMTQL